MISETVYLGTQMDGIRALEAQTKLIKILGPVISSAVVSGKLEEKSILNSVATAIPGILGNFDDEFVNRFVLSLFSVGVFREGAKGEPIKVDFMVDFAGKINEMWRVVLFILEVNFNVGKFIKFD